VALLVPASELARLGASGVQRLLQARLREARGLRVRVLAPEGARVDLAGAETRASGAIEGALPLLVADGAEALVVFPGAGAGSSVTGVEEYAVWVTLAPTVASFARSFEERWAEAAR
jgi:hypothetical protein